ncbi:ABC transporter permease [Peptococcus niger]|uniref:Sulfonate transport system permease protein n=1 Tax=Peptococcus niger TaxID=2741 RepID=A0A1G6Z3S5_PEPNI|nr:ABC transporter permease [Peptococcus niger]SDD96505.1 sulfonate transport system permease protein [Peptococcus niger]
MSTQVNTAKSNPLLKALRNKRVLNAISIIGFLLIWDLVVVSGLLAIMPRPHEVLFRWIELMHEPYAGYTMPMHVWISFRRVIIAFLLAAAIGIPTGVIMAFSKFAHAIIRPIFEFFKPMPPIAWISLSILWFGLGEPSKIFLIFIGCVVPCILNSYNGIRLVDPELYDAVRNLGANYWQEQTQVTFPASLPAIFAGLQVALSSGWTCVVAAELVGAREGIGYLTYVGMRQDDIAMTIGGILTICLVSFLSSLFLTYLERWLCPWKRNIDE